MYCQKYSCRMNEQACRTRQTNNPHDIGCQDCEQGKEIMARYNKAQSNLEEIEKSLKKKKRGPGRPPKKKPNNNFTRQNPGEDCLLLNFQDHPELYKKVHEAASAELRTPENQVLYILKNNFI